MKKTLLFLTLFMTMLTFGARAQVPVFSEGFEGTSFPAGWTTIDADNDGFGWELNSVQGEPSQGHTGSGTAVSYSYDNIEYDALYPDNWLISPAINLMGTSSLSFWFEVSQYYPSEHYGVYISTTSATDTSAFTLLYEMTPTADHGFWTQQTIDLTSYTDNTVYIAFRHFNSSDMLLLALDDIVVSSGTTVPTLIASPSALDFGNVNPNDYSAVENVSVNAFNCTASVTASVGAPFEISTDSVSFGYSATLPSTGGTLYVRYAPTAEGSDQDSIMLTCGSLSYTVMLNGLCVDCSNITMPFSESFEDADSLSCWLFGSANSANGVTIYNEGSVGTHSLRFSSYSDASNYNQYAVTPELPVTNSKMVTFDYKTYNNSNEKFSVGYSTTTPTVDAFVWGDTITANNSSAWIQYMNTAIPGEAKYIAINYFSNYLYYLYVDNFLVQEVLSCLPPTTLSATDLTSSSATLHWAGDGTAYNVYYKTAIDTDWIVIPNVMLDTTGYLLSGLNSSTTYQWRVATVCDDGTEMVSSTSSFATECGVITAPFMENFNGSTSMPQCWARYSGLASDAFAGTNPSSYTGGWNFSNSYVFGQGQARLNIYGSSCKYWLVTPPIDLSNLTTPALFFDLALTAYGSSNPISSTTAQQDDKFIVMVSTDNGASWSASNATIWSNDSTANYVFNQISATGEPIILSLANYANDTVLIAFYGESTSSGGDNDLHIDNIRVEELPNCLAPTSLTVSNVFADGVTLNWNGEADSYNIYDMSDNSLVGSASANTYNLTDLTPSTQYTYGVAADCNGDESQITTITFTTACSAITLPYAETFEANSTTVDCWTVEGNGNWSVGTGDYEAATGAYEGSLNAKVTHTNTGAVSKFVSPVLDGGENGIVLDFAYVMRDWSSDVDELRIYTRAAVDSAWHLAAEFTNAAETWTLANITITEAVYQVAFEYTDKYGYGVGLDNVFISPLSGDYCYAVTNLTVSNITSTGLSLSWNDENNSGATYTLYNMADTSVVASGVSTTSYDVTGLDASTTYSFGVVSNCSATSQSFFTTVTTATDCGSGSCLISIAGHDSYGDGWNGNTITVMQNGLVMGTFTIASGANLTETFSVCSDAPVSFSWTTGSYPDETSFEIIDGGFITVHTVSDGSSLSNGVFFTLNSACPSCIPANNLHVDAATETSVTISWTGSADSYDVYNGETLVDNVTTTTYTFTGLTTATSYVFGVQGLCADNDSASLVTITSSTECSDIATLPYYEGFEDGLGCWSTINGSSDGEPWYTYDCANASDVDAHGGNFVASSWSWSTSSMHANAWLLSPKFVLPSNADTLTLTWWDFANSSYPDSYSVLLSTTTKDTAAFTTVIYPYTSATGDWTIHAVDLTQYAGQSVYIAFHHQDYDNNFLFIDDIALFEGGYIPPAPDSLTVTVTFAVNDATMGTTTPAPGTYTIYVGNSIDVTATPNSGYQLDAWILDLYLAGAPYSSDTILSSDSDFENPMHFGTLPQSILDNNVTVTITAVFAPGTAEPCDVPTNLHVVENGVQNESIAIAWDANANVSSWNIRYRVTNGSWSSASSNTNSYTITGLTANTTYEIQVQANCGGGNLSDWSGSVTQQTTNVGIENHLDNSVVLFPNPAKEYVDIRVDGDLNVTLMEVYDVYGKLINTVNVIDNPTRINVSSIANGMYFVRVTTEAGAVTKTFVKR